MIPEAEAPPVKPESDGPRWPAWYAPAGFLTGIVATFVAVIAVQVVITAGGGRASSNSPAQTDVLTVVQDLAFVATAIVFAGMTARPTAWQFGLRGRPLGRTALWAGCAYLAFFIVELVYTVALNPSGKQSVTKDLGVDRGTAELVAGAFVVLVIAPVCEEFFFRGFFFRALRSRFNLWAAAAIDGVIFGAIHYTGTSTLSILPILIVLGFTFCFVYERTGTLYATIALHAINNSLAYGTQTHHGGPVSAAFGGAMVIAAAAATVLTPASPRRASG